jgi:hypothetical protein
MDTLYHYCSTATFHAIVQNSSVWLSSLTMSNDSSEGQLVRNTLVNLAKRDNLEPAAISKLEADIRNLEEMYDGLGLCLSEDGDLLGQWRAYSADGTGVSIGFNRAYLEQVARNATEPEYKHLRLSKVEYSPDGHEELLVGMYREIRKRYDGSEQNGAGLKFPMDSSTGSWVDNLEDLMTDLSDPLYWKLYEFVLRMYLLKPHQFREEGEWRLHTIGTRGFPGNYSFHPESARIKPYLKLPLEPQRHPISQIVLGPKHKSDCSTILMFLQIYGFGYVDIVKSKVSYR